MGKKLYVLLDCPLKDNDKKWIERLSVEGFETIAVGVKKRLSQLIREGIMGRIENYWLQIKQSYHILIKSNKDDAIIVWYSVTGQIINLMSSLFGVRRMILMNFLTPSRRGGLLGWMLHKTILNKNNIIFVNSKGSIEQYKHLFNVPLESGAKFFFFPDVFDDTDSFTPPNNYNRVEGRYFFTGGMTNRDWKLIVGLASRFPEQRFVCVALKSDFESQITSLPPNVEVYYNLPTDKYYEKMINAFCVLLPLRSDAVSGLINILKSIQYGVPCFISSTPATRQYYPDSLQYYLVEDGLDNWCNTIADFMKKSEIEYKEETLLMQKYIQDEFTPERALKRVTEAINLFYTN